MVESFITAFITYFVVIESVGSAPIFPAVTEAQDRARKLHTKLEGTAIVTAIMLFLSLCGPWSLAYLNMTEATFKINDCIILFLVALDILAAKRQQRKRAESTGASNTGDVNA